MSSLTDNTTLILVLAIVVIGFTLIQLITTWLNHRTGHLPKDIPKAYPLAAYTSLYWAWTRYRMRENQTVLDAHNKHGPIVQLAPREISINCVDDGIRVVYGTMFLRHGWYSSLWNHGKPNMVSYEPKEPHSVRKRMLSGIYSKSNILKSPVLAAQSQVILSGSLRNILERHASTHETLNMYYPIAWSALDISAAFIFGYRNSSRLLVNHAEGYQRINEHQSRVTTNFFMQEWRWLWEGLQGIGFPIWSRDVLRDRSSFEAWLLALFDRTEAKFLDPNTSSGGEFEPIEDTPVVYGQLRASMVKIWNSPSMDEKNVSSAPFRLSQDQRLTLASETSDHLIAGFETTAAALTFLFHELVVNTTLQSQLRTALRSVPRSTSSPTTPDPTALEALPLVHALVYETLRLYPPVAGAQARVTPHRTASETPLFLANHGPIPGGIRVSARCYCLHRNATVFPDPESFKPERWLDTTTGEFRKGGDDDTEARKMHAWWWAFGSGGSMCLGSHLAIRDMKSIVAAAFEEFELCEGVKGQSAPRAWDQYVGGPVELSLDVSVRRVE